MDTSAKGFDWDLKDGDEPVMIRYYKNSPRHCHPSCDCHHKYGGLGDVHCDIDGKLKDDGWDAFNKSHRFKGDALIRSLRSNECLQRQQEVERVQRLRS